MDFYSLRKAYKVRSLVGSEHMFCILKARANKTKKCIINIIFCHFLYAVVLTSRCLDQINNNHYIYIFFLKPMTGRLI